jgi:hypothetical protein
MPYQTYYDLVENLITTSGGGAQDAEQRDIRTAVQRAYQELGWIKDWEFHQQTGRVVIEPAWQGEVTFVASTRTITKTVGDPFPAGAAYCFIRINDVIAKVATRTSSSVLVLDSALTYPEDFSTSTVALLYRTLYPLPTDFRNLDRPIDEHSWSAFSYVSQDEAMKIERVLDAQGPQAYWTVTRDDITGGWAIRIIGYPARLETIDFTYRRSPRQLRYSGHETATRAGTVTASGTTVTGTGTSFNSAMVGSIIRIGTASDSPETISGLNPYVSEAKITAVGSATSLTVNTSLTASSAKYLITDPVDFPPGMTNCLHSATEYWLARIRNQKADQAFSLYQRDLRLAMENDQLAPLSGARRVMWDLSGWRSTPQADGVDGGSP